jgi:predicted nucleic acid-binding protein
VILVDTSIWIRHWREFNPALYDALNSGAVLTHALVLGEISVGNIRDRESTLAALDQLPRVLAATHTEVLAFVTRHRLWGRGIGWIDAHLLASAKLADCVLWTLDKRLVDAAHTTEVRTVAQGSAS